MPLYENEICPVCDKAFTAEDDVVICPVCGTPHHRECYNRLGKCANKEKHDSGYEYSSVEKSAAPSAKDSEVHHENTGEYYSYNSHSAGNTKAICPKCGEEIERDAPFCNKCGERQSDPSYSSYTPPSFAQYADSYADTNHDNIYGNNEIDGKSIKDISSAVRTNQHKFIPKFIKGSKLSWNWAGFFFGPFYLLFRKMYKEGILFLAVRFALSLFIQGAYADEYAALYSFINEHMTALLENPTTELMDQLIPIYEKLMPMGILLIALNLIISIIIALTADRIYKSKIFHLIDKVDNELDNGGEFGQVMPMMMDAPQLSQRDMRRLYLNKLGGTSFMAPVLAYVALEIISSLISKL